MSNLYIGPFFLIDASYQVSVHLTKQFQRRFFWKFTNQKQELPMAAIFVNGSGPILESLVWPDRISNPWSTAFEASTLTITPPMRSFIMEVQSLFNKSLKYNLVNQLTGIPQCTLFLWTNIFSWTYRYLLLCDVIIGARLNMEDHGFNLQLGYIIIWYFSTKHEAINIKNWLSWG